MPLPCLAIEMNNQHMATTFHSHRKKSVCHVVIDIIWTVVEIGQTVMTHAFVGGLTMIQIHGNSKSLTKKIR